MNDFSKYPRPLICLVRHGQTNAVAERRYNGSADIPLTPHGEAQARAMTKALETVKWAAVLCSPMKRARRTAELAGFPNPEIIDDLHEFDYGRYEGKTTEEIYSEQPDWNFWRDGCPGGETLKGAKKRLEAVIERLSQYEGTVLVFSHSHTIKVLSCLWVGLEPELGEMLGYETAHISCLGVHRGKHLIMLWNDGSHLSNG